MLKTWKDIGFTLEKTQDGSFTLRRVEATRPDFQDGESMHHSGGALEESIYIYQPVMKKVKDQIKNQPGFISVGLGLGYNEMLLIREFPDIEIRLHSFEIVPELKEFFLQWLNEGPLHSEVQETYDDLAERIFGNEKKFFKKELQKRFQSEAWLLRGALEKESSPGSFFHGILYDAFSKAVSPELWDQDFLEGFLKDWAAPTCYFSTYSCTGALKRALKASGFTVGLRLGFKGKRNSTWAYRESEGN